MGIRKELCEKIKAMFKAGISTKEIAEKFNLKESIIRTIIAL